MEVGIPLLDPVCPAHSWAYLKTLLGCPMSLSTQTARWAQREEGREGSRREEEGKLGGGQS